MKKIILIDMDNVLCDFDNMFNLELERNPGIQFPQSQYGFFRNLHPINESIETTLFLDRCLKFDVYILTAPSPKNPMSYSEKREWVEKHLGLKFVYKLIISPNKGMIKGHYLIDDNTHGSGQELFSGKLIHFKSQEFMSWNSVREFFVKKYNI